MVTCVFKFFPELKRPLRGRNFTNKNELVKAADGVMCYRQKYGLLIVLEFLFSRMIKCVKLEGYDVQNQILFRYNHVFFF